MSAGRPRVRRKGLPDVRASASALLIGAGVLWSMIGMVLSLGPHPIPVADPPPPVPLSTQYWGTFYYPWYADASEPPPERYRHWTTNWTTYAHRPPSNWSSNYLPDDGSGVFDTGNLYSSLDRNVIRRHLSWMERAGFDLAAVSWWGQSIYEDQAFSLILQEASREPAVNLRLAVYYEVEGYSDPGVGRIVSDLRYIYHAYAGSAAYFAVPGGSSRAIPVVFVYGVDSAESTHRWARARATMYSLGEPVFIVPSAWVTATGSYRDHATLVDGWHVYGAHVLLATAPGYAASASPGHSQIPELGDWPLFRRDPVEFAAAVRTVARLSASQAQFLMVPTFNEWHEGTQIEPSFPVDHNDSAEFTQIGPSYGFLYLDIVRSRGALLPQPRLPAVQGCVPPPPGLVSWWSGDGTPSDLVGFNMGTRYNQVSYADGKVGQAFDFGGVDDWVLAPGMGVVDLQELTIDFWLKLDSTPLGKIQRFVTLNWAKAVLRYDGSGPQQLHFYMDIEGTLRHIRVNGVLQVGAFHHVAGTYDGTTMRLYLDGAEVGSLPVSGFVGVSEGVALSTGDAEALDGLLDEVQVFDRALSAEEIRAIFEVGTAGQCKPP